LEESLAEILEVESKKGYLLERNLSDLKVISRI
jgi:hypothetical protein